MTDITFAQTNRLFTHCLGQLEQHSATTSPQLTPAQNALLAYLRFDKIAEEEGLVALIAKGLGTSCYAVAWRNNWRLGRFRFCRN